MPDDLEFVLKEATLLTKSCWVASLERFGGQWQVRAGFHLDKRKQGILLEYLQDGTVHAWLSGSMSAGRPRSRRLSSESGLECSRFYAFPTASGRMVLLVGDNEMDRDAQRLWRMLSLGMSGQETSGLVLGPEQVNLLVPEANPEGSLSTANGLERILAAFTRAGEAAGGWLGICSGDQLDIRVHTGSMAWPAGPVVISETPLYLRIQQTMTAVALHRDQPDWSNIPVEQVDPEARAWIGIPVIIGQRTIGLVIIWRKDPFTPAEWQNLTVLAAHVAPVLELSITFDDMASHMRRLALLNDFARTVSSASDLDEIALRVFALLRRTFSTDLISLYLISADGEQLRGYRHLSNEMVVQNQPVRRNPLARMIRAGNMVRLDDIHTHGDRALVHDGTTSLLLAPLKYRGQVIGALDLESRQPGAFSVYDENLLQVIASHLAGLVEYGRLREDAEARARNLGLIHEVVEQVIGLTDVSQVAQIVADLLTKYFAYELALVLLVDETGELSLGGVGGTGKEIFETALSASTISRERGISGYVLRTGESMLVNDVSLSEFYIPVSGWSAGSEMCVVLSANGTNIGIIDIESTQTNAFSQNDLLVLEALAGILSGVIASAEQYQRLQLTRDELQARIEAQREAERRFIQAAKLAAVGEMAAGVAHELNNPLTTVSGFAELVHAELPQDSPQRDDVELILREAARARGVVRRLLDFSRQSEMMRTRADLNEVVADVLALTNHLLRTSGVRPQVTLVEGLPWPSIDRNQIKQVLLNLLHNAMYAMPDGGDLFVTTEQRWRNGVNYLTVAVRDTGVGIPPENLDRIFEPFFTTRSESGGTGLGLSVSYGIVTDHGGIIDVESQVEVGSCFTIWLPVESQ
jgi:signal transduction histidine kinase